MCSKKRPSLSDRPKDGKAPLKRGHIYICAENIPAVLWDYIARNYAHDDADAMALSAVCKYTRRSIPLSRIREAHWTQILNAARFGDVPLFLLVLSKHGILCEEDYPPNGTHVDGTRCDGKCAKKTPHTVPPIRAILRVICKCGCLPLLKLLATWGNVHTLLFTTPYLQWARAAKNGYDKCATWIHTSIFTVKAPPDSGYLYTCALEGGKADLIAYAARGLRYGVNRSYIKYAMIGGHLESIRNILAEKVASRFTFDLMILLAMKHGYLHVLKEWYSMAKLTGVAGLAKYPHFDVDVDAVCDAMSRGLLHTANLDVIKWAMDMFHNLRWHTTYVTSRTDPPSNETCGPGPLLCRLVRKGAVDCIDYLLRRYGKTWKDDAPLLLDMVHEGLLQDKPAVATCIFSLPGAPKPKDILPTDKTEIPIASVPHCFSWKNLVDNTALNAVRWMRKQGLEPDFDVAWDLMRRSHNDIMFKLLVGEDRVIPNAQHLIPLVLLGHLQREKLAEKDADTWKLRKSHLFWWMRRHYGVDMGIYEI